eukprot:scaffold1615_cov42-Prasinocladus_malaysianus.AAC.2
MAQPSSPTAMDFVPCNSNAKLTPASVEKRAKHCTYEAMKGYAIRQFSASTSIYFTNSAMACPQLVGAL